jgi:hypothetical protein
MKVSLIDLTSLKTKKKNKNKKTRKKSKYMLENNMND